MRRLRKGFALAIGLLLLMIAVNPVHGVYRPADGVPAPETAEYAFVRFGDAPIASYDGSVRGYDRTKPERGDKLDLQSPAAGRYGSRLEAQRRNYLRWLARHYPQVEVVAEYAVTFNGVGLRLNGATLRDISHGPGAVEAGAAGTYRKAMNTSHGVINDLPLWTALGGQGTAGAGIKVGIIDSGIDQEHPFLQPGDGMAMPEGYPRGQTEYTSDRVIVARVFHQNPWLDARAVDSHGTHVAGTVAGRAGTDAPMSQGLSGVAPGAWLGNYNVFPGTVESATSLFIAKAVEQAVIDGMDVLNLSLGGGAHRGKDLLDMAVDAAADAGVVVAVAAGNSGPGNYTVGSPGTAGNVITVAAVTNAHSFTGQLHSVALGGPVLATTGSGNGEVTVTVTGEYDVWADYAGGNTLACSPVSGTPLAGKIALIQRGVCTFSEKINNAAAAGAVAVIVYQREDVDGDPSGMATDGVTIPAVMIARDQGMALAAWAGDRTVTLEPVAERPATAGNLADFSSWGPTPNYTLKPDVAAPGVFVYSSVPGGGYEAWDGTSMATPHVAGASALLLAHSRANGLGWGPAEVKAALMGTASPTAGGDPLQVGAGLIDLGAAMNPPALAKPASLSFGLVRPVGGHGYSLQFRLTNSTNSAQTYDLSDASGNLELSPASVTLAPGESAAVTATVAEDLSHSPGHGGYPAYRTGFVLAESAGGGIRVPYLYVIDYNR